MNNPNETNTFTFQINRRRLTRMQCWIRFSFELNVCQFAGQVENRFQIAFQIKKSTVSFARFQCSS
jgi:hypothetical protein